MNLTQNEESIFAAVIEQPTSQARAALLEKVCGNDSQLRARVEQLIWAHEHPDSFLAGTSGIVPIDLANTLVSQAVEQPGTEIGQYRLLERVGEGGMGVVYLAEQSKPVRRRVALKIIKPGLDTEQVVARFSAEQQALALMNHPNIARVLDAGATQMGRPYLVMEFVRGEPITEYCDREKLNTRQRLELFVTVCQAVQHAHQKGLIHRDLKPSNVLVEVHDVIAVPKVIDFGVAKAIGQDLTDDFYHTGLDQIVGTPLYMSPEQAGHSSLDVDTRSDIYSLGVLLYEMLTGHTPFARDQLSGAGVDELRRLIREVDPLRPSARISTLKAAELATVSQRRRIESNRLGSHLRGELDWIVMKSLEKDRSKRYETAASFARDVQRYLADETVEARPPSARYRLGKMLRRHKGPALAASLVVLALAVGVIGTTWGMLNARTAWLAESKRAESESRERHRAELAEQAAADEAAVANAVNQFMREDVFGMASAISQLEGKIEPDPNVTLQTLLDRALLKVDERFANQPRQLAAVQHSLGAALKSIGRYEDAARVFAQALEHCAQTLGPDSPETLEVSCDLANVLASALRHTDGFDKVLWRAEETFDRCRNVLGLEHLTTLYAMDNLAHMYREIDQHDRAISLYMQELELRRKTMGPEHPRTLEAMTALAGAYWDQDRLDLTIPIFEKALPLFVKTLGTEHPETIATTGDLGVNYVKAGRVAEGMPLIEQAYEKARKIQGPEHPNTLRSMLNLSATYWQLRRFDKSIPLFEESLSLHTAKWGPENRQTLRTMSHLGQNYFDAGRTSDGMKLLEHAFKEQRNLLGFDHRYTLLTMSRLANANVNIDNRGDAISLVEEALQALYKKRGRDDSRTLQTMNVMGALYIKADRAVDAITILEQAFEKQSNVLGPTHVDTIETMKALANAYGTSERFDRSIPLYEEALRIETATLGANSLETLRTMHQLGAQCLEADRTADAFKLYKQAFERIRDTLGPDHSETLAFKVGLALAYESVGKLDVSTSILEEVLHVVMAQSGEDDPRTLTTMDNLGTNFLKARRANDALPLLERVYERRRKILGPEHTDTLRTMAGVATACFQLNRLTQSIPLFEELLQIQTAKLPADHPKILQTMFNLGVNYFEAGRTADAIRMLESVCPQRMRRALRDYPVAAHLIDAYERLDRHDKAEELHRDEVELAREQFGAEDPRYGLELCSLGYCLLKQQKLTDAEPVLREGIAVLEQTYERQRNTLGPTHADTIYTMGLLGKAYFSSKKFDRAIPLLEEALRIATTTQGPDSPETLRVMKNLGANYHSAGRTEDALKLCKQAMERQRDVLGPDHPDALNSMDEVAAVYQSMGKNDEFISTVEELLQLKKVRFGEDHPLTLATMRQLGRAYEQLGQHDKAEKILRAEIAFAREQFGAEHPRCGAQLCLLGDCLLKQQKWNEAEPVLREGLAIREKTEADRWTTFNAVSLLGAALLGNQDYAAAEPLLLRGYEGMKQRDEQIPPQGKFRLTDAVQRLIELYAAWDKPEEATKWRALLPAPKSNPPSPPVSQRSCG